MTIEELSVRETQLRSGAEAMLRCPIDGDQLELRSGRRAAVSLRCRRCRMTFSVSLTELERAMRSRGR